MKSSRFYKWIVSILLIWFTSPAWAQSQDAAGIEKYYVAILAFLLVVAIVLLIISIILLFIVKRLFATPRPAESATVEKSKDAPWLDRLKTRLTDSVPVAKEETIMLDHEYDGIRELDNHLPPWWKGLFYFTIAFGVVYLLVYHVFRFDWAPLQEEAYRREVAIAEEKLAALAPAEIELVSDEQALQNGRQIYQVNCSPCHLADGGGSIGPNLTDHYWIHGGTITDVYETVKNGVPGKGMISWESKLSATDMRDVASFILVELVGSEPAQGKEPEGELFEPETTDGSADSVNAVDGKTVALRK